MLPFLLEVIDLLPLLAGRKAAKHHAFLGYVTGLQVLVGGFILRWVFVHAGQVSHFG